MEIKSEITKHAAGAGRAETLPVGAIAPAAQNVHAAERRGDETFRGLVGSIRANGLIHRIVVRPDPDKAGRFLIVDGHRRFEAAKAAGMAEVPVEVREATEAEALAVTVAANVQRLENDPVLEAEAIGRMLGDGMSASEVAARLGKGEGYVARRARLTSLAEPWRAFARRVRCTVDMLEKVAAHDKAVQLRVAATSGLENYAAGEVDEGVPLGWSEFEDAFAAQMRRLDEAAFDTARCAKCPSNTACHRYLFDWMETEEGNAPRCMDAECYARQHNAAVDAEIARLRRAGKPALEVESRWRIPEYWDCAPCRDRKRTQAYVYETDGLRRIEWSVPPPKPASAATAKTAEEIAAERAERRRMKLVRSARDKVRGAWGRIADGGAEAVKERLGAGYDELAARRLEREIGRGWVGEDFLDDFARLAFENATAAMDGDERNAYEAELMAADERNDADGEGDAE